MIPTYETIPQAVAALHAGQITQAEYEIACRRIVASLPRPTMTSDELLELTRGYPRPAGYVVTDNELIHGVGETADAAWADMRRTLEAANIRLLASDEDSSEQLGSWCRESGLTIRPASAALLAKIGAEGGACGWSTRGGVACTSEEY